MAIIQGNAKQGSTRGFYPKIINGSLRFNDDDSAYLTLTPTGTSGGRTKFTYSGWVKIGTLSTSNGFHLLNAPYASNLNGSLLQINSNDEFYAQFRVYTTGSQGAFDAECYSNMKFRDPSAWYHIVFAYDSTDSTAANRMKLWVNGVSQTFRSQDNPGSSTAQYLGSEFDHNIGRWLGSSHGNTDGYMANVHFIDGQALTADDFGETKNGVWVAKDYAGTFGTNGFYLTFEDDTAVEAFNTVLYRGTSQIQSVTGVGFQPDLVWVKVRNSAGTHILTDSVRGGNKQLFSNLTNAEATSTIKITGFESDGFTLGADSGAGTGDANYSGNTYVAWCWDAGANNAVTGHSSVTYTGSGSTMRVSGFPFSPDLVWYKNRGGAYSHRIYDTVRGAAQRLIPNSTGAETANVTNELISFDKDGFVLAGGDTATNTSGQNYIAWAWDAGDSDPVSNTNGSITSTVKASTTNGFSIVSWQANNNTLSTVGHGLSQAPDMVIIKNRDDTTGIGYWVVGHTGFGWNGQGYLNSSGAFGSNSGSFNNTAPTSSVFTVNTDNTINKGTDNYIAYCWHDVTGKQKFGTYTGDGGTSNSVTTGFRPGFVMIKRTDGAANWEIYDSSRESFTTSGQLYPNTSDVEGGNHIQFDSNGFTLTANRTNTNENTATYIYAAFAGSYSDYITDYNTDGSIDSRVKASDTTGFSIVSYEGNTGVATVGHGLSATPDFVIVKDRTNSVAFPQWWTWHSSLGTDSHLFLNLTDGGSGTGYFDTSGMSSSTIGFLSDSSGPNTTGESYIAYCWTETTGYSKFSSYSGTGSDHTSEISCGFRPAWIMIKRTDDAFGWYIHDATRDTDGTMNTELVANSSGAEYDTVTAGAGNRFSISDTGFTVLGGNAGSNASGGTYIYAAFADTREAAFWLDQSGNDNDWQPVNLDHNDTVADSPTNNFATLNPLDNYYLGATFSDGNLRVATNNYTFTTTTIGMTSGKYYAEVLFESNAAAQMLCGITRVPSTGTSDYLGNSNGHISYYNINGNKYVNGGASTAYGATYTVGDVIGIAVDMDAGEITFFKNGTSQGVITGAIDTSATYFFAGGDFSGANNNTMVWNFGQQPFKYDPPA